MKIIANCVLNLLQQHKIHQLSDKSHKVSSAEVLLVIAFCYYVIVGLVTLSTFAVYFKNYKALEDELQKFYVCEEEGHDTSNPCDESGYFRIRARNLTPFGFVLIFLHSFLHLMYVLKFNNIKTLRKKCLSCGRSMKGSLRQSLVWLVTRYNLSHESNVTHP